MSSASNYVPGVIENALKNLKDESLLHVICLSCASNDLISNYNAQNMFPENEKGYFFYNSISIVREIAKLVNKLSDSKLKKYFSTNTSKSFDRLKDVLIPFHEESLSKSVLKPIRDFNFHYNFPQNPPDVTLSKLISKLKGKDSLEVAVKLKEDDLMSTRYTYADWFRNEYINSHLSSTLVKQIAITSFNIIEFVDLLLADLVESNNG